VKLLVVEDCESMARLLGKGFLEEGYAVDVVDSGADALDALAGGGYDAIVLDVVLPDVDGFDVCARLRRTGRDVPVIMLTGRDTVRDRIRGLDVGADDYLCKPFSFAELCARVRALIRRGGPHEDPAATVAAGELRLDPLQRRVWTGSAEVDLSTTEFVLLELLMRNQGRVLSRSRILDHVWGFRYPVRSNVVDQYVRYLRHKVGSDTIETVRGVGYRLRDLAS
jgi:two-component system OmpR family response regulator